MSLLQAPEQGADPPSGLDLLAATYGADAASDPPTPCSPPATVINPKPAPDGGARALLAHYDSDSSGPNTSPSPPSPSPAEHPEGRLIPSDRAEAPLAEEQEFQAESAAEPALEQQRHAESAEEAGSGAVQPPREEPALEQTFESEPAGACHEGPPAAEAQQAEQDLGDAEAAEEPAAPASAAEEGQPATLAGSPAHDSEPGLLEDGELPANKDPSEQLAATQIDDATAAAAVDAEGDAAAAAGAAAASAAEDAADQGAAEVEATAIEAAAAAAAAHFAAEMAALVAAAPAAAADAASPRASPAAPGEEESGAEEGEIAPAPLATEPAPDAELAVCEGAESAEAAALEAAQQSQPGANAADAPTADTARAAWAPPTADMPDVISRLAEAIKVRMASL